MLTHIKTSKVYDLTALWNKFILRERSQLNFKIVFDENSFISFVFRLNFLCCICVVVVANRDFMNGIVSTMIL